MVLSQVFQNTKSKYRYKLMRSIVVVKDIKSQLNFNRSKKRNYLSMETVLSKLINKCYIENKTLDRKLASHSPGTFH